MTRKRISIAMCTYNGEKYLQEQLESIAFQVRLPDELVVCDDMSRDETTEIIEAFASTAPFPVHLIINERNLGATKNFEKAINLCRGDIIALSDQDDVWYPEKLMRIEAVFLESPRIGAVFTDAQVVDEHLHPLGYSLWHSIGFSRAEQKKVVKGKAFTVLLKHNVVTGATMAFRSDFRKLILPIPENWVHDAWIALIISAFGDLAAINEPMIKYRQHARNQIGATKQDFKQQLSTTLKLTDRELYLKEADYFNEVKKRLLKTSIEPYRSDQIAEIDAKIAHLQFRATIHNRSLVQRFFLVLREFVMLSYYRYSGGLKSMVRDLLPNSL